MDPKNILNGWNIRGVNCKYEDSISAEKGGLNTH